MLPKLRPLRYAPALALAVIALAISAAPAAANCTPTGRVCVTASSQPSTASLPSNTSGTAAYLSYTVTVVNNGPSNVTHASLTSRLSDSTPANVSALAAFVSTPGCTASGSTATCPLSLPAGTTLQFTQVVRAPALFDPTQVDQLTNTFTVMFDEVTNDNPSNGGKTDTISTSPAVDISGSAGTTFVPAGSLGVNAVDISTSATGSTTPLSSDTKIGHVDIPTTANGFVAALTEPTTDTPPDCTTFIGSDGKKHICRGGGWFQATVPGYPFTGKFLTFDLYWDASVINPLQTPSNFEVFHANSAAETPQQWEILTQKRMCTSATDPGPCFVTKVTKNASGDYHATVRRPANGHMR
jgi:Domain of unknown function DUF11